jgi:Putative heavy-metal-binding
VGFFRRGGDEDAEQTESLARIEAGGIPPGAEDRLRAIAGEGALFTSGLSVNEFALLDQLGPQPLAQVMGASVVRTGWQYLPALDPGQRVLPSGGFGRGGGYGPSLSGRALSNPYTEPSWSQTRSYKWHTEVVCELDVLTDAWNLARRRALDRLSEEALQVGADAVVGVHLHRGDHDFGKGTIEYVVTGTAIRLPDAGGSSWPTLTDVSGQDYWRLAQAGHEAVGLVATTSVVFASPARSTRIRRLRTTAQNQELKEISQGFHAARDTVRGRLRGQVPGGPGAGLVGVELSHSVRHEKLAVASSLGSQGLRGWNRGRFGLPYYVSGRGDVERGGWVITMHGAGTAIHRRRSVSPLPVKTTMRMGATR